MKKTTDEKRSLADATGCKSSPNPTTTNTIHPTDSIPAMGATIPMTRTGATFSDYMDAVAVNLHDRRIGNGDGGIILTGGAVPTKDGWGGYTKAKKHNRSWT